MAIIGGMYSGKTNWSTESSTEESKEETKEEANSGLDELINQVAYSPEDA